MASWIEHSRKPYAAQHRMVGLEDSEVLELVASFRLCGFWRFNVESGHLFGTPEFNAIFGLAHVDGPINLVDLCTTIHPDDLASMMETFERASVAKLTYHNLYRVRVDAESYKFVRSVGRFRAGENTGADVVGMTYELFPQKQTVGFIADDDLLPPQ